ncbi:oligosaccharide flippase family protein [Serratia sp. M24T3]|uniref:oligosaccharide flippase family protein n=1 Tax=Serratia sp. M24T3 TaxID=932213 RepID=UPI00025BA584|nr:oligosaccharide flippase family protein [Serratia sp. M24T3]EIC82198.1 polysaccharide biosynthesis protein [Serratia sp. M24T3]
MNQKIIFNSLWMLSEKVVSILGLIFVTSYIAKYVGPTIYGQISFAMSIFLLIQTIAQLGSAVIIFKRISKNHNSGVALINSTVYLRATGYIICAFPVIMFFILKGPLDSIWFLVAACIACFFSSVDVYSIYYDATLKSKINTAFNVIGVLVSLMLRWGIAELKMAPIYLTIPIIFTSLIPYLLRSFAYRQNIRQAPYSKRNGAKYRKYLMMAGSTFVLSDISVAIYTRLPLLFLAAVESKANVGIYSVSVNLASAWSFIAISFISSNLPSIFSEKDFNRSISITARLNLLVVGICTPIIIAIFFLGAWFITHFYGASYQAAYIPLLILSISTMVSALGIVSARFIAKFSGYSFLSRKMFLVLISSMLLNYALIKEYSITGAAMATLLTELLSLTLYNYFFKNGAVFKLHYKTLTYPLSRALKFFFR